MSRGHAGNEGERLLSLDAARGLCLLAVVSGGLGLPRLGSGWWAEQWQHRPGVGCTVWDLLAPAFLLIAGIALPYSRANRQGQSWPRVFLHALLRAGVLLALGVYLDSYRANRLVLEPRGDLQLIALATFAAFLVVPTGIRGQAVTAALLLTAHAAGHLIFGGMTGLGPWEAGYHLGAFVDRWLHLAPHPEQAVLLNLVPATATVLLGAVMGEMLRGGWPPGQKLAALLVAGGGGVLAGWALAGGGGPLPFSWPTPAPLLPRLWTASFVLFAAGWATLLLAGCYALIDALGWHTWSLPLALVGRNSLVLFLAFVLFRDWAARSVNLVLPDSRPWVAAYKPFLSELCVVLVFWLFGLWLYRRRIFVKV